MAQVLALTENSFKLAEYERHIFAIQPEAGVKVEDIIKPEYWANVAKSLTQGALIEARAKDGAYFAQLYVVSADKSGLVPQIKIIVLRAWDLNLELSKTAPKGTTKEFKVVFRNNENKHTVTRTADGAIIKAGFATKKDAEDWIEQKELGLLTE